MSREIAPIQWLGGSACAGKTSIATRLAGRYSVGLYHCDERFVEHRRRADPDRHPRFCRIMDLEPAELFGQPLEVQVEQLRGFYEEELEMVVEDVAAPDSQTPLLVEGAGLLPTVLGESLAAAHDAIWLIATAEFRRSVYRRRGSRVEELLAGLPEPESMFDRWMRRDDEWALWLQARATERGFKTVTVDGSRTVADLADEVAAWLALSRSEP